MEDWEASLYTDAILGRFLNFVEFESVSEDSYCVENLFKT